MIKIVFFDLDNTLAPVGLPVPEECVEKLRLLRQKGCLVAVCSGKPVAYINGFGRQLGIRDLIMIGETGAEWQIGVDLPPSDCGTVLYPMSVKERLSQIKKEFDELFHGKYWLQPNMTEFTVFPIKEEYFPEMNKFFSQVIPGSGLDIYCQPDCFDIMPQGINKGTAVKNICDILKIPLSDSVSVGDGINDYPMFEITGLSIGINLKQKEKAELNFDSLDEVLNYLTNLFSRL